ncbi:XRE family transcriptional regulator [Roseovarius sp. LXJ103]|uniref:helix-turn-helix domain-containing protein n=1 Tax=Roseovarius carneus TaxID=2853164 RepID=UPI000D618411|nr:XRE family transcriptional regulator [Roseovarius carneus]MBZ8118488.1 XRE family transcriptional regulator [Roseovarius carneus]PWE35814.1 XRE family transcriptional regulator [Pelagicola sp. LXJ1103]
MHQTTIPETRTLGADLRALRKSRGITLSDLAEALGRSVGWLSQVERDLSTPSVSDLHEISAAMGVQTSLLFGHAPAPAEEAGYIVRRGARRPIGADVEGLTEELLSPDLTDDFEVVHSTFAPHSAVPAAKSRPTQEVGYILSGQLDLRIGERAFTVGPGDSFRIRGELHEWANPYDIPCVALWVIAPPVY